MDSFDWEMYTQLDFPTTRASWALVYRQFSRDYIPQENEARKVKRRVWAQSLPRRGSGGDISDKKRCFAAYEIGKGLNDREESHAVQRPADS